MLNQLTPVHGKNGNVPPLYTLNQVVPRDIQLDIMKIKGMRLNSVITSQVRN